MNYNTFNQVATGTTGLGGNMPFGIQYAPINNTGGCKCLKIRIYQVAGRFKKNGKLAPSLDPEREKRTTDAGWRIDLPQDSNDHLIPFIDNLNPPLDGTQPWVNGNKGNGTFNDRPGITHEFETFRAWTCFVGEREDGSLIELGCLSWAFTLEEKGKRGKNSKPAKLKAEEPTFSCRTPQVVSDARDQWDRISHKDFHFPDLLPQESGFVGH